MIFAYKYLDSFLSYNGIKEILVIYYCKVENINNIDNHHEIFAKVDVEVLNIQ